METTLFNYSNYRDFLKTYYTDKKQNNYNWSYEAWARKLGVTKAHICNLLNGNRLPGDSMTEKLCEYFQFGEDERNYFEGLVDLAKVDSDSDTALKAIQKISSSHPQKKFRVLNNEELEIMGRWQYHALWALVGTRDFVNDSRAISYSLNYALSPEEVEEAINKLLSLRLLAFKEGKLVKAQKRFCSTNNIPNEVVKTYHENMIQKAKDSIRSVPVGKRNVSSITISVDRVDMGRIKNDIDNFKEQMMLKYGKEIGDDVYQLNVQLFPLSMSQNPADAKEQGMA